MTRLPEARTGVRSGRSLAGKPLPTLVFPGLLAMFEQNDEATESGVLPRVARQQFTLQPSLDVAKTQPDCPPEHERAGGKTAGAPFPGGGFEFQPQRIVETKASNPAKAGPDAA